MPLVQEVRLFSRFIGQRTRGFRSTAFGWGGAAGATVLYLTDWKLVMQYVPFVNKKFDHDIPQ